MALILGLSIGIGFGFNAVRQWQKAKNASLALQATYAAQRAYLADHPTLEIANVTPAQLEAYLPQGWSALPVVTGLNDELLTLDHTVMPPVLLLGGTAYDPSDKSTDGLWDVGE